MLSDYVQCDYCGRRFNQSAAERHIPFCKEKSQRVSGVPSKPGHSKAAEKQAKRTQVVCLCFGIVSFHVGIVFLRTIKLILDNNRICFSFQYQYQAPRLKPRTSPGVSTASGVRNTNHSNSRVGELLRFRY